MPDAPPDAQQTHKASSLSSTESARLSELAVAITSNAFDFSAHLEYVSLLHTGFSRHVESGRSAATNYELLSTLKTARQAMDKLFPVGEALWVEWLTDENFLARSIDERQSLMDLHHRSVLEEPSSAQLWLLYGDYMYYLWSSCAKEDDASSNDGEDSAKEGGFGTGWTMDDKIIGREVFKWDSMLDVWDQGIARTQWHLNDSNIVWDRYMEILLTDLSRNKTQEKTSKIRELFVDRLTNRAHATWDQTLSAYSTFVSTYYDAANYEEEMVIVTKRSARAKKVFELREPYEFRVQQGVERMDKQAEWAAYSEYLDWELRMKGVFSKDLINGLYERATTRFATDSSLWNDYVEFLVEAAPLSSHSPGTNANNSNTTDEDSLPSLDGVLERATRHCPWSGELWSHRLLAMEVDGRSFAEIEEVKHKATVSGLVETRGLEDLMKVYVAWAGYLSRRAFSPGATEDEIDMAEVGILSSLEHVHKVVAEQAKAEGIPIREARGDPHYRLERIHIKFLFKRNDQDGMRQIWADLSQRTGVADTWDFWNRYYMWALIIYERNRHIDNIDGNRQQTGVNNPNPNQPWREGTQVLEKALLKLETIDWPEQVVQAYINHCEQHETVLEYRRSMIVARKAHKLVAERREREQAAWKAQQEQAQAQEAESQPAQPPEAGEQAGKRKRDVEDVQAASKKLKQAVSSERTDVNMVDATADDSSESNEGPRRDREHAVIVVKNLPETATELKIRQFFRECGTIKSLNLIAESTGTKTATVEFETKEDALYAQTKATRPFDGQGIEIEFGAGAVLWVANYPPAADEKYIRGLFQSVSCSSPFHAIRANVPQHGEILQVRFPSLKLNSHRRFCYVQFSSPMEAQAAADTLDGHVLDGKYHLQAKVSDPSKRQERTGALHEGREVIVKNVDWSATEEDVSRLFEETLGVTANDIQKINMPRTVDGKSKGTAFVSLSTKELVDEAIKKLDNVPFRKRTLKVERAIERGKRAVGRIVRGSTEPGSERGTPGPETNGDGVTHAAEKPAITGAKHRTIAIMGLPDTVNTARLESLIEKHTSGAAIKKLTLRTDHAGAIVEFVDEKGAGVAGMAMDGLNVDGKKISLGSVAELLKQAPVEKASEVGGGKKKPGLGFGAGVVQRPRALGGPKARLGGPHTTKPVAAGKAKSKGWSKDAMEVEVPTNGANGSNSADEKKNKSNAEFRDMFLKGSK
jgi:RNA recognition motif-containing protein